MATAIEIPRHPVSITNNADTEKPILEGLNASQLNAVTTPAAVVQILAPPGSGKTRTLTCRVAYLLSQGLNPSNVIVATFTVKASREMKHRIGKLIGNGLESRLILGTFHSIARRYLVKYGHLIDIKQGFGIADTADSTAIIKRIIKREQLNIDPSSARSRISHHKAQGQDWKELTERHKVKDFTTQEFAVVYREYEQALAQANLLDYDDLLLRCVDLLKKYPQCVSNVEAVLIDEFQDTNLVQFHLMTLFATSKNRVTIVGDPDQSIYGFRAAEIKNLKRMRRVYPDTLVVVLQENYRSSAAILNAAQVLIEQDQSRPSKKILPTHAVGTRPVLRKLKDAATEAQWVVSEVRRITAMTGNMVTPNDFVILVRSSPLTRNVETCLTQAGIPYRMVGGHRFYDRVEVKTVVDYLRIIHHPGNNDALARVINVPPRSVGEATIKNLLEEAHTRKKTLWELIRQGVQGQISFQTKLVKRGEQGLVAFVNVILTAQKMLLTERNEEKYDDAPEGEITLVDIIYYLMKKLKYQEYLKRLYPEDHDSRWANVEELVIQATEFTISAGSAEDHAEDDYLPEIEGLEQQRPTAILDSLDKFLASVALTNEIRENADNQVVEQVTISTIHAAKGLEWPIVFLVGVYEGSIPHSRSEDIDEERRLLYVAMTRAQALLYLSCPKKNSKFEKSGMSQFMDAQLIRLLDKKGPSFTPNTVQSISEILSRPCPSLSTIELHASKLLSREDDQLPIGDETSEEENSAGDRERKRQRTSYEGYIGDSDKFEKRGVKPTGWINSGTCIAGAARFSSVTSSSTSVSTTMSPTFFSINSTTMTGFKTAKGHLQDLHRKGMEAETKKDRQNVRKAKLSIPRTVEKREQIKNEIENGVGRDKVEKETSKKSNKWGLPPGQQRLPGFITVSGAGHKDQRLGTVHSIQPTAAKVKPMTKIPAKPQYVLLSSSPGRPSSPAPMEEVMKNASLNASISMSTSSDLKRSYVADSEEEDDSDPFGNVDAAAESLIYSNSNQKTYTLCLEEENKVDDIAQRTINHENGDSEEMESLNIKPHEPILPPPLLTRPNRKEFPLSQNSGFKSPSVSNFNSSALSLTTQNEHSIAASEASFKTTPVIPDMFNKAAAKAIIDGPGGGQRQRTLGVRRSMNGWADRMARKASPRLGAQGRQVERNGRGAREKGKGFIQGLLG